jgi:hypothetical protein
MDAERVDMVLGKPVSNEQLLKAVSQLISSTAH